MKILKFILLFINILVVVFTLLSYVSPYINPEKLWFFSFFGLAFIYLVLLNILFIVLWLFLDAKKSILSIVVLLAGLGHLKKTIAFSHVHNGKKGDTFKVMSYNLNQGMFMRINKQRAGSIAGYINKQKPDILLLQELNSRSLDVDKRKLDFRYKYTRGSHGAGIYTGYRIVRKGLIEFGSLNTNSCLWADLKIGGDTVRVYSVHFMSNHISQKAEELVDEVEKKKNFTMDKIKGVFANYKRYVRIRADQVNMVKSHVERSPYPVILGGDFNDPPVSYTYNVFDGFLKDAFLEGGRGFGFSYAGTIPFLRIDFIFVSDSFEVSGFEVDKSEQFSDHYPVSAYVRLLKNAAKHQR